MTQTGLLALRAVSGGLMAGHGLQKLKGWFGGGGLDATAAGFEQLGLRPGRRHAVAAGVTETAAGVLTALGALLPVAGAATTGVMTVAVGKVHGPHGLWITKGGWEYNLAIIAAAFALTDSGPGPLALDGRLFRRRTGLGWALAQLAVGVAAGLAVMAETSSPSAAPAEPPAGPGEGAEAAGA